MALSHFVEKLKIGKKYILLDLMVQPDSNRPSESAGPDNKFIPVEVWKMIYRTVDGICRKQLSERAKSEDKRCDLDREYECRVEAKPNYLLKYEFKGVNFRTVLNAIFNDDDSKLHSQCLLVRVADVTKELYRELQQKQKIIEKLEQDNEKLRAMPAPSQEYTPTPVRKSNSAPTMEYIPTAINGGSPVQLSSYKARKIEHTPKSEPDPYTPTSSQEAILDRVAYVPTLRTPSRSQLSPTVPSMGTASPSLAKRRRRDNLFGSDDEEDETGGKLSSPLKVKEEDVHNRSDELFSPIESPKVPVEDVASTGEECPTTLKDCKRTQLPRKTKTGVSYSGLMSSDENSPLASTSSANKRRRRDEESDPKGKSNKNTVLDGWLEKPGRKKDESSAKDKENDKRRKPKPQQKEETPPPPVPIRVDHDKLREDAEKMRKTMAGLEVLNRMFPEDKSQEEVVVLNCHQLSNDEIIATFADHRVDLKEIYEQYKDKTDREWLESGLCNFMDVTSVLTDDQTYAMIKRLEEFNSNNERGMYTDFFASTLVMEWGLRIWMAQHGYTDRKRALERIKLQEEANPMDLTPTTLNAIMSNRSRKR